MNADPFLRRLEWTATIACAAMTAVALALYGGRPAAGVVGGGVLIAFSYWTIGSGLGALTGGQNAASAPPRAAWIAVKIFSRYALLVLLAYVMIARLGLHPLGLLAGASSVVAAASVEACRVLLKKS